MTLPLGFRVSPVLRAQPQPDVAGTGPSVDDNCQIVVTLENRGPGEVPLTAYDRFRGPTVTFRKDGAPFGRWRLNSVDPSRQLRQPGGSVTWTRAR